VQTPHHMDRMDPSLAGVLRRHIGTLGYSMGRHTWVCPCGQELGTAGAAETARDSHAVHVADVARTHLGDRLTDAGPNVARVIGGSYRVPTTSGPAAADAAITVIRNEVLA
jgi:hypothetical protein